MVVVAMATKFNFTFGFQDGPTPHVAAKLDGCKNWNFKFGCRMIIIIANYVKYAYCDADGIDNVTL